MSRHKVWHQSGFEADAPGLSLCDALDRVLNKGVVVTGDILISVAGVDLLYVGVRLLLSSIETIRETGFDTPSFFPREQAYEQAGR